MPQFSTVVESLRRLTASKCELVRKRPRSSLATSSADAPESVARLETLQAPCTEIDVTKHHRRVARHASGKIRNRCDSAGATEHHRRIVEEEKRGGVAQGVAEGVVETGKEEL